MKQAIIKKGKVLAEEVPVPDVTERSVLIKVANSCISVGTEISGVKASKDSFVSKVVKDTSVIGKVASQIAQDGISVVTDRIKKRLSNEKETRELGRPTGYSVSGLVIAVGKKVNRFKPGDLVAAAGAGYANHAEYVQVPENLVMRLPDALDFMRASTATLGGIALQGVRRADLKLGEFGVVFGAGILGLLSVQLLAASGIRVIAVDLDERRLDIAKKYGAELIVNPMSEDPVKTVNFFTGGNGADAVLFTAATALNEPLSQSFTMCKKKGRVILVGVVGMDIQRHDMYAKELDFLISTSYGPGRYDKKYEEMGLDYPYAYVRWTENRNMEEYLRLLSAGKISLDDMIDKVYPIGEVTSAYEAINNTDPKPLLVFLSYDDKEQTAEKESLLQEVPRRVIVNPQTISGSNMNVALIGTGSFTSSVHIPNFLKLTDRYRLYAIAGKTGLRAKHIAEKYQAAYATTDYYDILNDENVDVVFICTQHDSHGSMVLQALQAGKNVFVEKPLTIHTAELDAIKDFFRGKMSRKEPVPLLMVGYNRRFSEYNRRIKDHIANRINPLNIHYRMNAGYLPPDHWVFDQGGRIIGEACHIVDLMTFFTESNIKQICVDSMNPKTDFYKSGDNKKIILTYEDGSICSIDYFSAGNSSLSKEYMEIHFDGKSITMNDYYEVQGYGVKIEPIRKLQSPKGHYEELVQLYNTLSGKSSAWPIELWDLIQTSEICFHIADE